MFNFPHVTPIIRAMLTPVTFSYRDRLGVDELDHRLANSYVDEGWVQDFFIGAYKDIFDDLPKSAPAIAMPYNCGAVIATNNHKMIGIDLALIENYYNGQDWDIPSWLYAKIAERLDLLIVSHGHWDHCWIELIEEMIARKKTVIVPQGMKTSFGKGVPDGCRGVLDGEEFWFEDVHLAFRFSTHAYDASQGIRMLTTRIWDGKNSFLHTADADVTNSDGFQWYDKYGVDILLFKVGGMSPLVRDYEELEETIYSVSPKKMILPMHLNELGHKGTDACRSYSQAYDWMYRFMMKRKLGNRVYGVLFGNRFIKL